MSMYEEVFMSVTGNDLDPNDLLDIFEEADNLEGTSVRATTLHGTYVFKVVSAAVSVNGNVLLNLMEVKEKDDAINTEAVNE